MSRRSIASGAAWLLAAGAICGCDSAGPTVQPTAIRGVSGATSPNAFARTYPDLRGGRAVILAHFEQPEQAAAFRLVAASGTITPAQRTTRYSREETGAHALEFNRTAADERLVYDRESAGLAGWIEDWRPFSLLFFSVYSGASGGEITLRIESADSRSIAQSFPLRPAWNLIRVDLAALGGAIDLANVRALRWETPLRAEGATTLYLDDLLLADNTRVLLGSRPTADDAQPEGRMYAVVTGDQLIVGASGRFELTFADGVIRSWQSAGVLTRAGVGVGPWLVPQTSTRGSSAGNSADDPRSAFAAWGAAIDGAQTVVEAGELRVRVHGEQRFMPPVGQDRGVSRSARPGFGWEYTIYADGRVYVRVEAESRGKDWPGSAFSWHTIADESHGAACILPEDGLSRADRIPFALWLSSGASLTWSPFDAARARIAPSTAGAPRGRVSLGNIAASDVATSAHLLRFWPPTVNDAAAAEALSEDYQNPAAIRVEAGKLRTSVDGDLDRDGFNESQGCHEIEFASGLFRGTLDPDTRLRSEPIVRLHSTRGRSADVLINDVPLESPRSGRDEAGNLLFVLPSAMQSPMRIEIALR